MAKGRPYVVPMTLDETRNRLQQITSYGMRVDITCDNDHTCRFVVRRIQVGRRGRERTLDTAYGQMSRSEDNHTQVEPQVKVVAVWRLVLVYALLIILGIALSVGIALATESLGSTFSRRLLALLFIYILAFLVLQPQNLFLGNANDDRLNAFINSVLSGPYADVGNLYVQYFNETRYWETR